MRARLLLAAGLAASVVGAGIALERAVGVRAPPRAVGGGDASGAWFCPHGGGRGWRVWVVLANPSPRDAEVRLTTYGAGEPFGARTGLLPGTEQFAEVPATEMSSGTVVEFFGGGVAAGFVASRTGAPGLAAEPCAGRAGRRFYLADGTAERGEQGWLVAMNPSAMDAVLDVTLVAEDRAVRPGALQGMVIPARRAAALELGRYAPGERTLAATVHVSLGEVAVGGVGVGESGVRAALAAPAPGRTWLLPGAADDGPTAVPVLALGEEAPFRLRVQGSKEQVQVLEGVSVPAGRAATFEVAAPQASVLAEAEGAAPFVAARRLSLSTSADRAATGGARGGARAWVALPAVGPDGGQSFLVLQNPGDAATRVTVSLLTVGGRVGAPGLDGLTVGAGRTAVIDLSAAVGVQPVAAVAESGPGAVVVAQVAVVRSGYAVSTGVRIGRTAAG